MLLIIVISLLVFLLSIALTLVKRDQRRPKRGSIVVALFPSVVVAILFWSLAIHMGVSTKGWPDGIGYDEFSGNLLVHAKISFAAYWQLFGVTVVGLPIILLVATILSRLRFLRFYLMVYSFGMFVVTLSMSMAPRGYLDWWLD